MTYKQTNLRKEKLRGSNGHLQRSALPGVFSYVFFLLRGVLGLGACVRWPLFPG